MFTIMLMMTAPQAATSPPLVPSSKWVVDYAEQSCVLSRSFRTGDDEIGLALVPNPTSTTEIILFLPEKRDKAPSQEEVVFLGKNTVTAPASSFVLTGKPIRSVRAKVANEWLSSSSKTLEIRFRKSAFSFPMTDSAKGVSALKACQEDLLKGWGVDPATSIYARAFRRDTTVARGDPDTSGAGTWFKEDDYPLDALGLEGEVKARWQVGLDGKPFDCLVFKSSGVKALDDATCEVILKKGMYDRIMDKHGMPSAGWDWQTINWLRPL